jgi:uncharacterized membrane protein YphA (DoxX/SURF4 family)
MNTLNLILQFVIALGILNVWLLRFGMKSQWRGGDSTNMKEEFAVYGLPPWSVPLIGAIKVLCAIGLLVGIWIPSLVNPSAAGLAILMLGAGVMHVKVSDPPKKSLPAATLLILNLLVLIL